MDYAKIVEGRSSLFKLEVQQGRCVHRFDVNIKYEIPAKNGSRKIELTKQTDGSLRNAQNLYCRKLVKQAAKKSGGFGIGENLLVYCYDGRSTLYATKCFQDQSIGLKSSEIESEDMEYTINSDLIVVALTPNERAPGLDYSDFTRSLITDGNFTTDHSVCSFLEVVTSHWLITHGNFQGLQAGAIYNRQPTTNNYLMNKKLEPGMLMYEGMQKGVRIVDDKTAFLILDLKRVLLFGSVNPDGSPCSLAEIFKKFDKHHGRNAKSKFEDFFKGVRMITSYNKSQTMQFYRLSEEPVDSPRYNVDGKSVPQYYKEKYQIDIRHPHLLGAQTEDGSKKDIVYPLEVLYVLPGQFIPQEKHDIPLENSVKPTERYEFIMRQVDLLSSGPAAAYLQKFGIRIVKDSNRVKICHRRLPQIRFKDNSGNEKNILPKNDNGSFFRDVLQLPLLKSLNLLKNWIIAYDEGVFKNNIEQFLKKFTEMAKNSGFNLPSPKDICKVKIDELEEFFLYAGNERIQFILYVDDQPHSHSILKMYEAKYKILTQQLRPDSLIAGNQTIKNIVLKFNSKCFGVNFLPVFGSNMRDLDLEKNPQLLVIGYDVAHPTNGSPQEMYKLKQAGYDGFTSYDPSVVGICANKNAQLGVFSGDFFYQESRREELSSTRLVKAIKDIIMCAHKTSKQVGRKPTQLIIIRDGVSEGQFRMAIQNELVSIKLGYAEGMKAIGDEKLAKTPPKITFLVGIKRHNKRFFRVENNVISNTCPGDVVNAGVTRQDGIQEFFLQGSAKATQYDVLINELNIPRTKLEEFILLLSNMHQISGCPTSIPLPIYLADETADRGQQIYKQFKHYLQSENKPKFVKDFEKPSDLTEYFDKLTEMFGYAGHKLAETRFT